MSDSDKSGWVRLHRKINDSELWLLEPFTKAQAWIDLFLNANHKDGLINIRGNIVPVLRGQIAWSEVTMSKRWQWSRERTRRFLKLLESRQQIKQKKDRYITTIITIINYERHQSEQQTRQQKDSRRDINNNDKNEKDNNFDKSKSSLRRKKMNEEETIIDTETGEVINLPKQKGRKNVLASRICRWYGDKVRKETGVDAPYEGGGYYAVVKLLNTMNESQIKDMLEFYIESPKFQQHKMLTTACSADSITKYKENL